MSVDGLRSQAREVQNGFKPLLALGAQIEQRYGDGAADVAAELWLAPEHQSRMLAVIIWGDVIAQHPELLARLRHEVSADEDWRVHELLARSFCAWCTATGWEEALPTLASWLADDRAAVRRAATEGPRVWTRREYFKQHPEHAVRMLLAAVDDPDDYARRSAENALRDVLKRQPQLAPEIASRLIP
jgi:hypothetical protein